MQLTADIWNAEAAGAYPISTFTYLIVPRNPSNIKDAAKTKALADFLRWAATDGQNEARSLDFAPVGSAVSEKVVRTLEGMTMGVH